MWNQVLDDRIAVGYQDGQPTAVNIDLSGLHPFYQEFVMRSMEALTLALKKGKDYGTLNDPVANLRAGEEWGIRKWVATSMRMNDKETRLKNYAAGSELQNEGARDSVLDNLVYSHIRLVLFDEEEKGGS